MPHKKNQIDHRLNQQNTSEKTEVEQNESQQKLRKNLCALEK